MSQNWVDYVLDYFSVFTVAMCTIMYIQKLCTNTKDVNVILERQYEVVPPFLCV